MPDPKEVSQSALIISYYTQRPNTPIQTSDAVDWATEEWVKLTGTVFRDPDRAIRKASQEGKLVKVSKGVYMYDPDIKQNTELYDFSANQKREILERDNYRCVVCGRGVAEGVDLQIDHIRPKDLGGKNTLDNGQVLCGQHNFIKKNYSQTEAGKRFFIKMKEQALKIDDTKMVKFCDEVLEVYTRHGYDDQIQE